MPTYRYVAVGPDGDRGQGQARGAERGRAAQPAAAAQPRGQAGQAEEDASTSSSSRRSASRARRSCTSRARWPRSCAPASRSPRRSRSSRTARATSASGRSSRRCASRSTTACRSRTRSPSTRRCSRRTTSASCARPSSPASSTSSLEQLSGYIERDLEARSKIKSAMIYPMVIFGMSIVTVVILAVCVHAEVRRCSSRTSSAKLPLPTRMLIDISEFVAEVLVRVGRRCSLGVRRAADLDAQVGARAGCVRDRLFLRVPLVKDVVLYAVTERVLPDHRRDGRRPACRCPRR